MGSEPLCFPLEAPTGIVDGKGGRIRHSSRRASLLHHVREFMSEQLAANVGVKLVPTGSEHYVTADGVRHGMHRRR
jgi:hypothetical protein